MINRVWIYIVIIVMGVLWTISCIKEVYHWRKEYYKKQKLKISVSYLANAVYRNLFKAGAMAILAN